MISVAQFLQEKGVTIPFKEASLPGSFEVALAAFKICLFSHGLAESEFSCSAPARAVQRSLKLSETRICAQLGRHATFPLTRVSAQALEGSRVQ